ncbi:hypothetical protein E3P99_01699 [Wallemia hederae]|uniref:HTH APSES-type domain-containing protein n=1 Tax=Wallemia hederae TaxID=1540922 RepID=A0A4T0FPM3_9BASI|nr:hypothetical protein E3P99_01699 [Wallemia hederae]
MPNRVHELWWDENKTRVWSVEVEAGNYVARRHDNDQVNGTKLLNITRITRGKRDGILKNEKNRQVVKTGTISLKGVWIPLERALALARQFHIEHNLYPLFEPNVGDYVENSTISQNAIKRKSLNNLMDSLTTTRELVTKRRSTVSTYNPYGGVMSTSPTQPMMQQPQPQLPHHQYLESYAPPLPHPHAHSTSPYDHTLQQIQDSSQYTSNRPRNTSSASDWMTNWSASSSSPVVPATPINGTFSPVMNTFQSLALHSPPVPISSYYYDSSSSYFPSYHQKQQQGDKSRISTNASTTPTNGGVEGTEYMRGV